MENKGDKEEDKKDGDKEEDGNNKDGDNNDNDKESGEESDDKNVCPNFPWKAPLTSDIDENCDGITERPALVVVDDSVDGEEQKHNKSILASLASDQALKFAILDAAKKNKKPTCFDDDGDEKFLFLSASKTNGRLRDRVAGGCGLTKDEKKTQILLLAIHQKGSYYAWPAEMEFSKENAEKFLRDYSEGKLEKKQMGM